jgi:hypothetical protein
LNEINTYWIKKTFDSYKNKPLALFGVLARKINLFVNNYEPHNNASVYFYEYKTALKYLPRLDYAIIFALAVMGMVTATIKRDESRYLILPIVLICLLILSVFFCSRYRMPIIPFFCLFAGYGITMPFDNAKGRNYGKILLSGIIFSLLLLWSYHPIPRLNKERDIQFWETRDADRIRVNQERQVALNQNRNWKDLSPQVKIKLAGKLGETGLVHEFFDRFDEAYQLCTKLKEIKSSIYLLSVKASLHEGAFQFKEAVDIWRSLESIKTIQRIARQKIRELEIVGPVLDPNFR